MKTEFIQSDAPNPESRSIEEVVSDLAARAAEEETKRAEFDAAKAKREALMQASLLKQGGIKRKSLVAHPPVSEADGISALHKAKEAEKAAINAEKAAKKAARIAHEREIRVEALRTENEIKDNEENTLLLALTITDEVSFSLHMGGADKSTDEGKARALVYNTAKERVTKAIRRDTVIIKARAITSYAPNKGHKTVERGNVIPGSVLDRVQNRLRAYRTEKVLESVRTRKLMSETTDVPNAAFLRIAKEQGIVPRDFAKVTESGNLSYPMDVVKGWNEWRETAILSDRSQETSMQRKEFTQALTAAREFIATGATEGMTEKQSLVAINKAIREAVKMTRGEAEPIASRAMLFPAHDMQTTQ